MYEAFFKLTGKPFQLNPDPDFFFGSRGHKRAMAYLEYGLHQGEGFIVITGEVGAGKTTLVRNLLRKVPSQSVVAAQIVSTQLEADDLLRLVAGQFGVEIDGIDKSSLLLRLEETFRKLHQSGRRALLIVDEAQNLSQRAVEELRMLSNFQIDTRSLVQSFLVGQPEFREIMQRQEMRQLRQRIIASYHLGPLDRQETQAYIEHRLQHVGWAADPAFDDNAFDAIHESAQGVPRRINTLCDRLLLAAFLGEQHMIQPRDVQDVAAELTDELGMANVPEATRERLSAEAKAPAVAEHGHRLDRLESRVELLEATASMTYSMVKRAVGSLPADAASVVEPGQP